MNVSQIEAVIRQRLVAIEERITAACRRAGRTREQVTLVVVTKTITPEIAAFLPELGVLDLGESRPQDTCLLTGTIPLHLYGHEPFASGLGLQRLG